MTRGIETINEDRGYTQRRNDKKMEEMENRIVKQVTKIIESRLKSIRNEIDTQDFQTNQDQNHYQTLWHTKCQHNK